MTGSLIVLAEHCCFMAGATKSFFDSAYTRKKPCDGERNTDGTGTADIHST